MGSRLRPVPDQVLECLIEVSAPSSNEGAKLLSYYPESYDDVAMLRDVVPDFCFPFAKDTEMVDAVQHFTFVLTSIDSLYRFGFCRYPPKAKTCLCIISDLPAFEMFYGMLNTLAELENANNEVLSVNQFMDLVLESQVPEPGCKFTITLPERDWQRQYNYPDPAKLPSIPENRNLTDYFSAVNPSNMIALFASMMFERRIIITSKKLSLLTACTYSASTLLYPMHWQHVFIPTLPPSLVEYCCAPMPFLVGVHSSLMSKVREMPLLDDVVILDVDKNEIEVPFDDLENIPSEALHRLESALKKSTIAIGDYVSQQFLSAIVVLIGGYRDALKLSSDTIVFERDMFVNSRPHMKPFLENLLTLQLFEQFIHHKLEQLNSGQGMDDVFEEHVGMQSGSDSKWASQYKQWMKNRKRDGSQLFKDMKARYKANKFIQARWDNVKNKRKTFLEYVRGGEVELDDYDDLDKHAGSLQKCNSLPMRKVNGINQSPLPTRNSIGSSLHNRIIQDTPPPAPPKRTPHPPSRPPPRVPSRTPPRPPAPYKSPSKSTSCGSSSSSSSDSEAPKMIRPSMVRNPSDPPVKDLIVFYDSQEDLTCAEPASNNPFKGFSEYDYKAVSGRRETNTRNGEDNNNSNPDLPNDLLWETFVSLSDDTRQFLRQSRIETSSNVPKIALPQNGAPKIALPQNGAPGNALQQNGVVAEEQFQRGELKKTLRELASRHKLEGGLSHSESCPSLFDPLAQIKTTQSALRSTSSTNVAHANNGGHSSRENVDKTQRQQTDDPFVDLITRRHNLKPPAAGVAAANGNPKWVTDFE